LPEDNVAATDIQRVGTMPLADAPAHIELPQVQYHYIQAKPQELDPKQQQAEANARVLEYLEKSLKAYEPQATHQLISVVENEEPNSHIYGLSKIDEINSFVEDEARAGANGQAAVIKLHQSAADAE